jgi:pimeloyl-ACP methyl ester carboxylesterase
VPRSQKSAVPTTPIHGHLTHSVDGVPIEYFSTGSGPGLVVVHGTMQSAASQRELASLLADSFTVHLVNRRGRGRSGAYPALDAFDVDLEVNDVEAVVQATGATGVLGISSGGIVAAEVGLRRPGLAVTLFEPAFVADGSLDLDAFLRRFEPEVERGDVPASMVTAMLGLQMGPGFLRWFPRRMLESTTRKMLAKDAGSPVAMGGATMGELGALIPYDVRIVAQRADRITDYAALTGPVHLVTAERSPGFLRHAVARLQQMLPDARTTTIRHADHSATQNARDGGRPQAVADAVLNARTLVEVDHGSR